MKWDFGFWYQTVKVLHFRKQKTVHVPLRMILMSPSSVVEEVLR